MTRRNKKLPNYKSVMDAAKFWDTHDAGDFMDELKIVKGSYIPPEETKTTMTIRLAPSLKKKIEGIAKRRDISTSSLVRMWMVDHLQRFAS